MNQTDSNRLWIDEERFGPAAGDMVQSQIHARGINNPSILAIMRTVPRHLFLPQHLADRAYDDAAQPTHNNQTISQPYIVAAMCDLLDVQPHHRILEIGTGTGYHAAILSQLAKHVFTIERDEELARQAEQNLGNLAIDNVTLFIGDGTLGLPEHAPFDRISVTAGAPHPPQPLLDQLADRGRMIIPVGDRNSQALMIFDRIGQETRATTDMACRFVPLVGTHAW